MPSTPAIDPQHLFDQLGLGAEGWNHFKGVSNAHGQPLSGTQYDKACEQAYALFGQGGGRALLQYLIDTYLMAPCWPGDQFTGETLPTYGSFREGQNNIVRLLHAMTEHGRQLEAEKSDE